MITCPRCEFESPGDRKFCQQCGEPLPAEEPLAAETIEEPRRLYARAIPPGDRLLVPDTYLDEAQRYRTVTVLGEGKAIVADRTPEVRSPLQSRLAELTDLALSEIQSIEGLPEVAYPYLMLAGAAPALYDVLQENKTLLILSESAAISPLLAALLEAVDPLQYVYWLYRLTELWRAFETLPRWRLSFVQADNLGVDAEQSLRVRQFSASSAQPPTFVDLKGFLQSLLVQPAQNRTVLLQEIRRIGLAVSEAQTLEDLSSRLAAIGKALLDESETVDMESTNADSVEATNAADSASDLDRVLPSEDESAVADDETVLLPMRLSSLVEAGRTDVGRQRDHNEDCFLIASSLHKQADNDGQYARAHGLYVLCDGMGGHDGGEVASALAAQTLSDYFKKHWSVPSSAEMNLPLPQEPVVVAAVEQANRAIYDVNETETRAGHKRMGTTLVMVLLQGTEAVVSHVGDSRLYQYSRRAGLQQVTTDHEVGQREMEKGIPEGVAYARPDAYQLTQALGPRDSAHLKPSVTYLRFAEDTLLLLCSDGLSDNDVVEDYLESHVAPLLDDEKALSSGLNELVDLANEVNGHDNISAIALQIKVAPDVRRPVKPQDAGQTILQ